MQACFLPADILLPDAAADVEKWAVVACDQFTSQMEYWQKAAQIVGDAPSTLNIVYPEVYLAEGDARIERIRRAMADYMQRGVLQTRVKNGFVFVRRVTESGERLGLVGKLDLEQYDFTPGTSAPVRATEGTILSRIPPRVRIRQGAPIESPHVMMLVDDAAMRLIEPLAQMDLPKLYDTQLMLGGGHISGFAVEGEPAARTAELIAQMQRESGGFFLAVGDGNHSLATAKACWEQIKPTLPEAEQENHPARFALCELVNLRSPALVFRPVHRVVFGADIDALQSGFELYLRAHGMTLTDGGEVTLVQGGERRGFAISGRGDRLPVDVLQKYLDQACGEKSGWSLDYVHGDADAASLAQNGTTARMVARFRPDCPIIAPTPSEHAYHQLGLSYGVMPAHMGVSGDTDELINTAVEAAQQTGLIKTGDVVIISAGVPTGVSGTTNLIKAHIVGNVLLRGIGVGSGCASGNVCTVNTLSDLESDFKDGDVIVTKMTSSEMLPYMRRASAVVVESTNPECHAAVACQAMGIPMMMDRTYQAVHMLKSGMMITVDADEGFIYNGIKA